MTHAPSRLRNVQLDPALYRARIEQVQADLDLRNLDGLLLLNAANIMWATGFFHIPNERPLGLHIPCGGAPEFLVPFLEKENVEENWVPRLRWYLEYPGDVPAEVWMLQQISGARIAVDGAGHTIFEAMRHVKPELVVDGSVGELRYLKSDAELALVEAAAHYADFGLEVAREVVAAGLNGGITELEVVRAVQAETTEKMRRELTDLVNFYRGAVSLTAHAGARGRCPTASPAPSPSAPATRSSSASASRWAATTPRAAAPSWWASRRPTSSTAWRPPGRATRRRWPRSIRETRAAR